MKPLTPKQRAVLDYMLEYLLEHQRMPTYREMMAHFGMQSLNGPTCHLRALEAKGELVWDGLGWRIVGIKLVAIPQGAADGKSESADIVCERWGLAGGHGGEGITGGVQLGRG